MPYNFVADSFHTKKLCSRLFKRSAILHRKRPFAFLRHMGKRVVDFLLVLIELFLLGVTDEALGASIGLKWAISLQQGLVDPKFQVGRVARHQPFFFS